MSNPNLPSPRVRRIANFATRLAILATVVGSSIAAGRIYNNLFPLELDSDPFDLVGVLTDLDESQGIPTAVSPPTPNPDETLTPIAPTGSFNLVLAGNDYRPGRPPACPNCFPKHTDVFVFVNVWLDHPSRVTMVSLPRELYLHVDGIEPDSQLRQLYGRGGIEWIKLWTEEVLGVELDGVIVIEMHTFEQIVNDLGGISVIAPESFTDKCGDRFYTYEQGIQYDLDGFNALCYARMRQYNPRGYFARQERHMDILEAIFQTVIDDFEEDPLVTSVQMVSRYYSQIETDMSPELIAKLIADTTFSYYLNPNRPEVCMLSIDQDDLELYPRPTEETPFLYYTKFSLREWLHHRLYGTNQCD